MHLGARPVFLNHLKGVDMSNLSQTAALLAIAVDAQLALWDAKHALELHLAVIDNDPACDRLENTIRVFAATGDSTNLKPAHVKHLVDRLHP
jgi:hypothetical protein